MYTPKYTPENMLGDIKHVQLACKVLEAKTRERRVPPAVSTVEHAEVKRVIKLSPHQFRTRFVARVLKLTEPYSDIDRERVENIEHTTLYTELYIKYFGEHPLDHGYWERSGVKKLTEYEMGR
jgi:hypothetical protein